MTNYRGWQMNSKNSVPVEIQNALQFYFQKNGYPPQILEYSDRLENVELPEGLQLVTNVVRIPKNVILLGVREENEN